MNGCASMLLAVEPGEARGETVARGGVEVRLRVIEVHPRGEVLDRRGELAHEAEPERGVRDLVDDGRARGQHAELDAEVRLAVLRDAVAGAVPAVDRAVVEAERLQLRDLAAVEDGVRVLLVLGADERAEARDVVLEDVERRRP